MCHSARRYVYLTVRNPPFFLYTRARRPRGREGSGYRRGKKGSKSADVNMLAGSVEKISRRKRVLEYF
jgi:hypothetical protein